VRTLSQLGGDGRSHDADAYAPPSARPRGDAADPSYGLRGALRRSGSLVTAGGQQTKPAVTTPYATRRSVPRVAARYGPLVTAGSKGVFAGARHGSQIPHSSVSSL